VSKTKFQRKKEAQLRRKAEEKAGPKARQDAEQITAPAAKELWPGAGLWLDWAAIHPDDFMLVNRRLEAIESLDEQAAFLRMLWEHAEAGCGPIFNELLQSGAAERVNEYAARCSTFAEQILNAYNDRAEVLQKLEKITRPKEVERQDRLTVAQCVWALHFCILAAFYHTCRDSVYIGSFSTAAMQCKWRQWR
jgi:hypothetical protein